MNILVVGGCGFIGRNLINKLVMRDHILSVIDLKDFDPVKSSDKKTECHKCDASSEDCREVFEEGHFDMVIHSAGAAFGGTDSAYGPDLAALANILSLCVVFHVKRFIYFSTSLLNSYRSYPGNFHLKGCPEYDLYCVGKLMCENYCTVYSELYNIDTAIIRLHPVYGPGQDVLGEGGLVLSLLKRSISGDSSKIPVYCSSMELSYISDVSKNLCALVESNETGILGFRGEVIEIKNLMRKIQEISRCEAVEITFKLENNVCDSVEIRLLDYLNSITPFDYGLYETFIWFTSQKNRISQTKKTKRPINSGIIKKVLPLLESIIFSLLSVWISLKINLPFDIKYILIITMGIMYGVRYSIASALICILLSNTMLFSPLSALQNADALMTFASYLFIAMISGFNATARSLEINRLNDSHKRLENLYLKIRRVVSDTRKSASMLAEQLKNSEQSFGKLFGIVKKLEILTANEILSKASEIAEELTNLKNAAFYLNCEEVINDDPEIAKEILEKGNVYINITLKSGVPDVVIPVRNYLDKTTIGVIVINRVPFDRININTEYIFYFTGEILSHYYTQASQSDKPVRPRKGGWTAI